LIFPILSGLMSWRSAPITWTLVFLNLAVLIYTTSTGFESQQNLEDMMKKHFFVTTQGRVYAQYLKNGESGLYPDFLKELGRQVEAGKPDRAEVLGQLAFRDLNFLNSADSMDYDGDQVAFRLWKKDIADVREMQSEHPSFTFGLNGEDTSMSKWVSYIFVHSGGMHFFGNMLFLVIFGAALEVQIGGLGMLVVFLLSGIFAAGSFAVMTGVTSSPLVGASGAISGIMALYAVMNWKRPARYFYWLFLPARGFMGFVYLPTWVAMVMWVLSDFAGYFGTLNELGGVAHTAHLGGEFAGLVTGLVLFALRSKWPVPRKPASSDNAPMGVLFPFLPPAPTKSRKSA
jgi:membrane associated rhomboid family serine protease